MKMRTSTLKNDHSKMRGAFINGVWHCDCEPRMPAEKFQTKNGGKNHGRWFFTCQKPQTKRCSFFLWCDNARTREESAVINNSRTELHLADPETPKKSPPKFQPPTPSSKARSEAISGGSPAKLLWSPVQSSGLDDESFDWSSSGDEELASVAEAIANDEESPKKTARTLQYDSPGKRKRSDVSPQAWPYSNDVFLTPSTTRSTGLLSPLDTQPRNNYHPAEPEVVSGLVSEALDILKPAKLSSQIEGQLVELLHRHELRAQGIARGRDITRIAVQTKNHKIAELQAQISALEAEKETSRTVIAHLKQDIATSPKRTGRSRFGNRSVI